MKTKVLCSIIALVSVLSFSACKKDESVEFDSTTEKSILSSNDSQADMYKETFDGIKIEFGETKYSQLFEKGWSIDTTKLDGKEITSLGKDTYQSPISVPLANKRYPKADVRISIATNSEDRTCDLNDSVVRSLYVSVKTEDSSTVGIDKTFIPNVSLPAGLDFGNTLADVKNKLGNPSEQTDNLTIHTLTYFLENGQIVVELESNASGKGAGVYSVNVVYKP